MKVTAQLNYLRISPRKVRAIVKIVKGLPVQDAQSQLDYVLKRSAKPVRKLLDSAVSNAVNNHGLQKDYLYVKDIIVNEGMKLKRYMPKAFGRAAMIQKKTSRIKLVLDELPEERRKMVKPIEARIPEKVQSPSVGGEEKIKETLPVKAGVADKAKEKPKIPTTQPKKEVAKVRKEGVFGGIKKMFRRKSI